MAACNGTTRRLFDSLCSGCIFVLPPNSPLSSSTIQNRHSYQTSKLVERSFNYWFGKFNVEFVGTNDSSRACMQRQQHDCSCISVSLLHLRLAHKITIHSLRPAQPPSRKERTAGCSSSTTNRLSPDIISKQLFEITTHSLRPLNLQAGNRHSGCSTAPPTDSHLTSSFPKPLSDI
jgi:hypothetical protein